MAYFMAVLLFACCFRCYFIMTAKIMNQIPSYCPVCMLTKVLTLTVALLFYPLSLQATDIEDIRLPDMGDSAGSLISPAQEKQLGDAFFRSLHAKIKINQDPEIQHYIQSVGQQLVANSDLPTNPFIFCCTGQANQCLCWTRWIYWYQRRFIFTDRS